MKVLVIAAHPDDEVLGCGATIAQHRHAGDQVRVLILGEGATSRYSRRGSSRGAAEVKTLRRQANESAKILQINKLELVGLPDNRFDHVDLLDIVKPVEQTIKRYQPQVIYTHFWDDLNIDHRLTAQAVLTATRPVGASSIQRIYSFEILSSTEWTFSAGAAFVPNYYVPLGATDLEQKLSAMKCYSNELCEWPHPRSLEGIRTLARQRGSQIGKPLAEAFMLIREVKA